MINLDALWHAAGRPVGKDPLSWMRGEGRDAMKRSIARGSKGFSSDPEVRALIQELEDEVRAERARAV